MTEFDVVNRPRHYASHSSGIECIQIARCMTFTAGNAFKYVFRCEMKNGNEDLEKARWYLRDVIAEADPVFILGCVNAAIAGITIVIKHEPDPLKQRFYEAFKWGDMPEALAAVEAMLAK